MHVFLATLKVTAAKLPRYIMFVLTAAVLTVCFAVLGRDILYSDSVTEPLTVLIVDNDNSTESRLFSQMFQEYELYSDILNFYIVPSKQEAMAEIKADNAAAAIILPENFAADIMRGVNAPFTIITNEAQYLKKTLVEYFALAFSDLLSASQSGVYAALDYTRDNHPDGWQHMFQISNLKFINMVLNRADMYRVEEHTVIDSLPFFTHFALGFWIFINITAIILFSDVLYKNFNPFMLKKMRLYKVSYLNNSVSFTLAYFCVLCLLNAPLLIGARSILSITPLVVCSLLLTLLCICAFLVFVSYLLKNSAAVCVSVCVFSLAGFFVSGGIIPLEFFSPGLRNLSYLSLNHYLYNLVSGAIKGAGGGFASVIIITCVLIIASALLMSRAARKI